MVQHLPFFWDTISQASRRSSWFYGQGWGSILLPYEIDSGHPTGFNLYLATCWKLFGRTLVVSHWAMFPIVWGIIYQIQCLVQHFFSPANRLWASLLILTDVTLLAQATLIAPDLVLLLGYLLGLRGILFKRSNLVMLGSILLVSVSLRGIFGITALGLTSLLHYYLSLGKPFSWTLEGLWRTLRPFFPAALLVIGFYCWHYTQTGWWLSTPNPGWAGHREILSSKGVLRNFGIIGWRLLDFGRWTYWLVFGGALVIWWRQKMPLTAFLKALISWPVVFLVVLSTAMVLLSNPITHRYFLPALIGLTTLGAYLLLEQWNSKRRWWVFALVLASQLSGHLWIYPPKVAQGWDASLAYLPYFHLREQALNFARENKLPLGNIATEFPAVGPLDWYELTGKTEGFAYREESTPYLFYTTVMNDFSDQELDQMSSWEVLWEESYLGHRAVIYQRVAEK
jgi:hypothetical protein